MRLFYKQLLKLEGPNDGLVSVESSRWGNFLGALEINHLEQMNWHINPFNNTFYLFREIVKVLKESEDDTEQSGLN